MLFSALIPVYLLVGIGFVAVRLGYFPKASVSHVNIFTVKMIVPVVIFLAVFNTSGLNSANWGFLLAYGLGSFAVQILAFLVLMKGFDFSPARASLLSMGAAGSNSIMLGLPIVTALYPALVEQVFSWVLIVENIVVIPITLAIADQLRSGKIRLVSFIRSLFKNPIFIALLLGLILPIFLKTLWPPLDQALIIIRSSIAALSLLIIGALLASTKFQGAKPSVLFISACKLLVMPALILALMWGFGVRGEILFAGITFASISVFGIYANFCEMAGDGEFGASVFFVTTLLAPISIWFWSLIVHGLPS